MSSFSHVPTMSASAKPARNVGMQTCRTSLSRQNLASERHEVLAVRERDRERARASARSSSSQSQASLCGQRYPARWRLRRRGPASAPTCGLGGPRPSHAGPHLRSPQIKAAHTACIGAPRGRRPRHPSVQLAVAASRAPFGRRQGRSAFADPGPGTHSHRIGACEDDGQEQDGLEPSLRCRCLQGRWHRCRVSPGWWAGAPLVYTAAGMRLSSGSMD